MLPSDMYLKIRLGTVGYNNKILVSDGKFSLGKNDKVNSLVLGPRTLQLPGRASPAKTPAMKSSKMESHKNSSQSTATQGLTQKQAITQEEERAALILFLAGSFTIGLCFDELVTTY